MSIPNLKQNGTTKGSICKLKINKISQSFYFILLYYEIMMMTKVIGGSDNGDNRIGVEWNDGGNDNNGWGELVAETMVVE